MAAAVCWFSAVPLIVVCLHLAGSVPHNSPGSPPTIDEAMMRSSPRRLNRLSSRTLGGDMVDDGTDMVLTQKQYMRLYKGVRGRADGRTIAKPWTNGIIPYEIKTSDFTDDQVRWIERSMRHWEEVTCVRFRPSTPENKNHVLIRTGQGCWSNLGEMGGTQIVNLDPYCFWIGMIEHELGHSIGLIHEHQRPQRDAYIRVNYYGVQSNFVDAVEKYAKDSDDKMGLEYDYTSVMHYSKTAFSNDRITQTLFTRDPTKEDVIGMILGPSFLDAKLVNLMYNCADKCDRPDKPTCSDDCFLNAECKCICKEDMPKENCADINDTCVQMKDEGECLGNTFFMHTNCRKSCGICKENGEIPHFPCLNGNSGCDSWAKRGDCETNAGYMLRRCRLACGVCEVGDDHSVTGPCRDKNDTCSELADKGGCARDPAHMLRDCTKSCDFCPEQIGQDPSENAGSCSDYDGVCYLWKDNNKCRKYYAWMSIHCRKACELCDKNITLPADCVDTDKNCHDWSFRGECSNNPGYMHEGCKLSCNLCDGIAHPNTSCVDYDMQCPDWAKRYECYGNPRWMSENCPLSCKNCPGDPPTEPAPCIDFNTNCPWWQGRGECEKNPVWMNSYCRKSCQQCTGEKPTDPTETTDGNCVDERSDCPGLAKRGDCETNPEYMLEHCKPSCGVCHEDNANCVDQRSDCPFLAERGDCVTADWYMLEHCKRSCGACHGGNVTCVDENASCESWAQYGECDNNPGYMLERCKKSCNKCGTTN